LRGRRDRVTVATKFGFQMPSGLAGNPRLISVAKRLLGPFPALLRRAKSRGSGMVKAGAFSPEAAGATYQGDPSCLIVNLPWMAATSSVSTVGSPPSSCMGSSSAINNALWQIPASIGGVYTQSAIVLADRTNANDGGHAVNLKGRINFLGQGSTPRCVTTWWDANPAKTLSTKTGGETPTLLLRQSSRVGL
jgi:hypothetical protein